MKMQISHAVTKHTSELKRIKILAKDAKRKNNESRVGYVKSGKDLPTIKAFLQTQRITLQQQRSHKPHRRL